MDPFPLKERKQPLIWILGRDYERCVGAELDRAVLPSCFIGSKERYNKIAFDKLCEIIRPRAQLPVNLHVRRRTGQLRPSEIVKLCHSGCKRASDATVWRRRATTARHRVEA